jgi:hypothetical protein
MANEVIRKLTPEEQELEKKKHELASLETELIQSELDLATLRAELTDFEGRYLRAVGCLYAELDKIEAQIAEAQARRRPNDSDAQKKAACARAQAEESAQSATFTTETKPKPTEHLKKYIVRLLNASIPISLPTKPTVPVGKPLWQRLMLHTKMVMRLNCEASLRIGKTVPTQLREKESELISSV